MIKIKKNSQQYRKWRVKSFLIIIALVFMNLAFMDSVWAADQDQYMENHCLTRFENGEINWSTGKVFATGRARPEDNRMASNDSVPGSARADANRKIIEILKKIKINANLSVGEYASRNDIILAGMEKTARDASIAKQYYTSALAVEITIETSMFGGFLQLILPEDIRQIPKVGLETDPKLYKITGEEFNTGLIIDARGLNVEPVLNPVIVSEQGNDVYSSVFISREFAVQNGVAKYLCSMEKALKDLRIGSNPLVFKGLRKEGKPDNAIVISMSDYRLLEKTAERHTFLKECRIIIVTD